MVCDRVYLQPEARRSDQGLACHRCRGRRARPSRRDRCHPATYAPHIDTGDFVIVVNAGRIALTGKKRTDSLRYDHSGRPGGLRVTSIGELLEKDPRRAVERAVWGMMPKNKLSRQQMRKLKVYAGPEHPHAAQAPQPYQITQIAQ